MDKLPSIYNRDFLLKVFALAIPVALQTVLQSLLGMADVLMVGVLGDTAIAAVGLAAKIHFLLMVVMVGIATSCATLVAQYYGAKDELECKNTVAMTLAIGLVSMLLPFAGFLFAADVIMSWINPIAEVSQTAALYLKITAPILVITQIVIIFEASLRALGNTTFPLVASAISVVLNICLNYLLIFGHAGFPEMGVAGAALATLVARLLQLLIFIVWIYRKNSQLAIKWREFKSACQYQPLKKFIIFSSPVVVNHVFWGVGNTAYHVLTGFAGTEALAVIGIIVPIEMLFVSVFLGLAMAASVMIGQSLGADKPEYAQSLYRFFDQSAIALGVLMSLLLWLMRDPFASLYSNLSVETRALLFDVLGVFCLCMWLKVLNLVRIVGILRAGGDNNFCFKADMVAMWGAGIPLFALAIWYGAFSFATLYALMFVEEALKCIPIRQRLRSGIWLVNLTKRT